MWLPLTDATLDNSCLYCLPAQHDPGHSAEAGAHEHVFSDGQAVRAIRSLPCAAGSVVAMSHCLLHWGSLPAQGAAPRYALSLGTYSDGFGRPFLGREHLPLPEHRLRLALAAA